MKVELTVEQGPMKGKLFSFTQHDTFVFGRSPDTACPLPEDNYVSRNHFLLEINPPDVFIRDLGSLNGTVVNGRKFGGRTSPQAAQEGCDFSLMVQKNQWDRSAFETPLKDGDQIEVGDTVMMLSILADRPCSLCGDLIDHTLLPAARRGSRWICAPCRHREAEQARAQAAQAAQEARVGVQKQTLVKQAAPPPPPPAPQPAAKPVMRRNPDQEKRAADLIMKLLKEVAVQKKPQVIPTFPGYEVIRKLGEGGMGAVFQARDSKKGQEVAIKIIRPEQNAKDTDIKRFRDREMVISKAMRHPNIVSCLGGDFADGVYYLVMEMVVGSDVQKLLEQKGRIPIPEACAIALQALEGLEYIHKHKVVHRDIKPPNILLAANGNGWTPKIADFGLSKSLKSSSSITRQGDMAGSLPFMPPDQLLNFKNVTYAADVFSMGATLYTMITGAFSHNFVKGKDPLLVILQEASVPIRQRMPQVPPALAEVIDCALSPSPDLRYENAKLFRKALQKAL